MSIIRCFPNHEHTAVAVAAIRARWAAEASFEVGRVVPCNVVAIRRPKAVGRG